MENDTVWDVILLNKAVGNFMDGCCKKQEQKIQANYMLLF